MSAHVLLNLLNELGKSDKMRGLPSILLLFRNEFNKFNNTGARMLDYFLPLFDRPKINIVFSNTLKARSCIANQVHNSKTTL